jgi:hypothetical protein
MLLLIETLGTAHRSVANYAVYRRFEYSMFGCVGSEERHTMKRRKRGCKSRHIHFSPGIWLGEGQANVA